MSSHMSRTTMLAAAGIDKSVTSVFCIVWAFFLMSCLTEPVAAGGDVCPVRQVLVLHSYSCNTKWTKSVMDGIESVLERYEGKIGLDVEYMDTTAATMTIFLLSTGTRPSISSMKS